MISFKRWDPLSVFKYRQDVHLVIVYTGIGGRGWGETRLRVIWSHATTPMHKTEGPVRSEVETVWAHDMNKEMKRHGTRAACYYCTQSTDLGVHILQMQICGTRVNHTTVYHTLRGQRWLSLAFLWMITICSWKMQNCVWLTIQPWRHRGKCIPIGLHVKRLVSDWTDTPDSDKD
jgi:hypothetical protein